MSHSPILFTVTLCDCLSASEITITVMGKTDHYQSTTMYNSTPAMCRNQESWNLLYGRTTLAPVPLLPGLHVSSSQPSEVWSQPLLNFIFINPYVNELWKRPGYRFSLITIIDLSTLIARFMGPIWGPSGADRTQVGPMLAPWTLLSGYILIWLVKYR